MGHTVKGVGCMKNALLIGASTESIKKGLMQERCTVDGKRAFTPLVVGDT